MHCVITPILRFGITCSCGSYASHDDLTVFMGQYRSDGDYTTFTVVEINDNG
jgi:hypothetical protein